MVSARSNAETSKHTRHASKVSPLEAAMIFDLDPSDIDRRITQLVNFAIDAVVDRYLRSKSTFALRDLGPLAWLHS